jgi:hypothetical protein
MRQTVIDTETIGLDPLDGHRIVEIGAVELINRSPSGQTFHCYLCPERSMPAEAVEVHGLTAEFLADKPLFSDVTDEFLAFVGDAPLVAHNAGFDIAFLNAELKRRAGDATSGEGPPNIASGEGPKSVGPRCTVLQGFPIPYEKYWVKEGEEVIIDDNQGPDRWGPLAPRRVRINGVVYDGNEPPRFAESRTYAVHIVDQTGRRYLAEAC